MSEYDPKQLRTRTNFRHDGRTLFKPGVIRGRTRTFLRRILEKELIQDKGIQCVKSRKKKKIEKKRKKTKREKRKQTEIGTAEEVKTIFPKGIRWMRNGTLTVVTLLHMHLWPRLGWIGLGSLRNILWRAQVGLMGNSLLDWFNSQHPRAIYMCRSTNSRTDQPPARDMLYLSATPSKSTVRS